MNPQSMRNSLKISCTVEKDMKSSCLSRKATPFSPTTQYQLSKLRLGSLVGWLKSRPEVLKHYDKVIQEQLKKNIIEPVNMEERTEEGKVRYLPHREVIRLDKDTTKLRLVYDASAKRGGPRLNDCLYS